MTKNEFLQATKIGGIRQDAFDLGGRGNECYVLSEREGRWDVYYSERGLETRTRHFSTEAASLEYLLDVLRADPSTRM